MKRVLLASTALCMGAGMAMADVTVSGDGRMGVVSNDDEEIRFDSRVRIKFAASAELDGGLTAGGEVRADQDGTKGKAGKVFLSGSFGTLAMGDVDGGAKAAVGHPAAVGYTEVGSDNEITYLRGGSSEEPALLYTLPKMGIVQAYASVGQGTGAEEGAGQEVDFDTFALGAKADLTMDVGSAWLGAGFESHPDEGHLVIGAGASVSGFTGKLVAGSRDDASQFGLSAGYSAGQIGTTVYYTDDTELGGDEALGVGLEWSLGGGAAIKTGVVTVVGQNGADDTRKADLGVTFGF
ncbi:MAG: porin [Rhodobacter sp.]|nr:porin [Rhodobacter sp.]